MYTYRGGKVVINSETDTRGYRYILLCLFYDDDDDTCVQLNS